jgi:hypothetical protein
MDFRTFTARQALATLGACLGFVLLAAPASARPDESDAFGRYLANHEAHEEQVSMAGHTYKATRTGIPDSVAAAVERNRVAEPIVIPYLSHGEGVLVGKDGRPESQPTVIPYLSHGLGVADTGSTVHLREQPDGFQPQLHGLDSAPVADDGLNWETTGYVAGAILAAMLLALMSTIALRDRRGLKSA